MCTRHGISGISHDASNRSCRRYGPHIFCQYDSANHRMFTINRSIFQRVPQSQLYENQRQLQHLIQQQPQPRPRPLQHPQPLVQQPRVTLQQPPHHVYNASTPHVPVMRFMLNLFDNHIDSIYVYGVYCISEVVERTIEIIQTHQTKTATYVCPMVEAKKESIIIESHLVQYFLSYEVSKRLRDEEDDEDVMGIPSPKRLRIDDDDDTNDSSNTTIRPEPRFSNPRLTYDTVVIHPSGDITMYQETQYLQTTAITLDTVALEDGTFLRRVWKMSEQQPIEAPFNQLATLLHNSPDVGADKKERQTSKEVREVIEGRRCYHCGERKDRRSIHTCSSREWCSKNQDRFIYGDLYCYRVDEDGEELGFGKHDFDSLFKDL